MVARLLSANGHVRNCHFDPYPDKIVASRENGSQILFLCGSPSVCMCVCLFVCVCGEFNQSIRSLLLLERSLQNASLVCQKLLSEPQFARLQKRAHYILSILGVQTRSHSNQWFNWSFLLDTLMQQA